MINPRKCGNRELCDLILSRLADFSHTGNVNRYLGLETYRLFHELTGRILWKRNVPYMIENGPEIIDEIVGEIMLRAKRRYDNNREFIIIDLYHYIAQTCRNAISSKISEGYYRTKSGDTELLILEDITLYMADIAEFTPSTRNLSHPEMVLMFESEINDLVKNIRYLLSQNNDTKGVADLLVWPIILAAFRSRPDIMNRFDKRMSMYIKYVIHCARRIINTKFHTYKRILY